MVHARKRAQFRGGFQDAGTFGSAITRIYRPVFHDTHSRRAHVSPVGKPATRRFEASVDARGFGELVLSNVHAPGHLVDYNGLVNPDESALKIYYLSAGTAVIRQDGREQTLEAGELGIHDSMRPYQVWTDTGFDSLIMVLPKSKLLSLGDGYTDLSAARFTADDGAGRMVLPYLHGLAHGLDELDGSHGPQMAKSTVDLLRMLFASAVGKVDLTPEQARAEQRREIASWISERVADEDLTPRSVASAHFMSVRSLHALFAETGTTVGTTIRMLRLDHAQALLRQNPTIPISEAGRRSGFSDPSYFSRAFRVHFGATPKEYRDATSAL